MRRLKPKKTARRRRRPSARVCVSAAVHVCIVLLLPPHAWEGARVSQPNNKISIGLCHDLSSVHHWLVWMHNSLIRMVYEHWSSLPLITRAFRFHILTQRCTCVCFRSSEWPRRFFSLLLSMECIQQAAAEQSKARRAFASRSSLVCLRNEPFGTEANNPAQEDDEQSLRHLPRGGEPI
jgi:hypothetical protein